MAILEKFDGSAPTTLRAHHRIGRAPDCDLVLVGGEVSAEHATLRWVGDHWALRDLGSRNGTWVDGRRLNAGDSAPLTPGSTLAFGVRTDRWRLVDASPPPIQAVPTDGGEPVRMRGQFIALPDPDTPELTVYRTTTGAWVSDRDGELRPVADGMTVTTPGRAWRLDLAVPVSGTADAADVPAEVGRLTLEFTVSQDEEHIELMARAGPRRFDLGSRSHHQLLLILARTRLGDRADGSAPTEEGWVYQDDLQRMLATSFNTLQVHIFRARRQLGDVGVLNAVDIVERRSDTGQIRLGVPDLIVLK